MSILMQALVGLFTLALAGLGGVSMFAPGRMTANFAVTPDGAAGLNTIRGVIGGLFLGCVSMLVFGLVTSQTLWFLPVAAVLSAVVVGRVIGVLADGGFRQVAAPIALELVMVAVFVGAHLHGLHVQA